MKATTAGIERSFYAAPEGSDELRCKKSQKPQKGFSGRFFQKTLVKFFTMRQFLGASGKLSGPICSGKLSVKLFTKVQCVY